MDQKEIFMGNFKMHWATQNKNIIYQNLWLDIAKAVLRRNDDVFHHQLKHYYVMHASSGGIGLSYIKTLFQDVLPYFEFQVIMRHSFAEEHTHSSVEQNRESRNRSTQICPTDFSKSCKSKTNSIEDTVFNKWCWRN